MELLKPHKICWRNEKRFLFLKFRFKIACVFTFLSHSHGPVVNCNWEQPLDIIDSNGINKAHFSIRYALAYYDAVISNSETSPSLDRLQAVLKNK